MLRCGSSQRVSILCETRTSKVNTDVDVSSLDSAAETEIETVALIMYTCTLCSFKYIKTDCVLIFLCLVENLQSLCCCVIPAASVFIIVFCDVFCYGTNSKCQQAYSTMTMIFTLEIGS